MLPIRIAGVVPANRIEYEKSHRDRLPPFRPGRKCWSAQVSMKRIAIATFVLATLAALPARSADSTIVEEIIARVNNQIITRSDYQKESNLLLQEMRQADPANADQRFAAEQKNILRGLIDRQLLLDKGADLGINVDADLVKRLDEIRKQMGLESIDDMEKAATAQGVSFEDFKQKIKNDMITYQVIGSEIVPKIQAQVTREEIQKFYNEHKSELEKPEQVRLSEILISDGADGAGSVEAAEKKANEALTALRTGQKFEDVAKAQSNGPSAASGGDLGYFKRGVLAKQLEDRVFPLKVGDYTEPIRTKQGFVIIKVTEHDKGGLPPVEEAEGQIRQALISQKVDPNGTAMRSYLTRLREEAYIDVKDGYVDTAASPNETKPVFTTRAATDAKKKPGKKKRFLLF